MSTDPPRSSLLPPSHAFNLSTTPHPSPVSGSAASGPDGDVKRLRWVAVCDEDEVSVHGLYPYDVDRDGSEYPILMIRTYGGLYALHDECPHRRIAISESGYLDGEVVHCGWHHWGFEVETGAHTMPTGVCVDRFDVKLEEGCVWIALPE